MTRLSALKNFHITPPAHDAQQLPSIFRPRSVPAQAGLQFIAEGREMVQSGGADIEVYWQHAKTADIQIPGGVRINLLGELYPIVVCGVPPRLLKYRIYMIYSIAVESKKTNHKHSFDGL